MMGMFKEAEDDDFAIFEEHEEEIDGEDFN